METQEILNKTIGTKESINLKPANVKIVEVKIELVGEKKTPKLVCSVKHPDNEELIHISSVKYEGKGKLDVSGLWINLDDEKNLRKGSALANFIGYMKVTTPGELVSIEVETVEDSKGYLCFKAY